MYNRGPIKYRILGAMTSQRKGIRLLNVIKKRFISLYGK